MSGISLSSILAMATISASSVFSVATGGEPQRRPVQPLGRPPVIATLQAFLFYGEAGKMGNENVAFESEPKDGTPAVLVNAVLGDNSEEGPSSSVMVVVGIQGSGRDIMAKHYELTVIARSKGKDVVEERATGSAIAPLKEGVTQKVPFVVHETGCSPMTLTVELGLPGRKPASRVTRVIPFRCQE